MIFPDCLRMDCLIPLIPSLVVSQSGCYMNSVKWAATNGPCAFSIPPLWEPMLVLCLQLKCGIRLKHFSVEKTGVSVSQPPLVSLPTTLTAFPYAEWLCTAALLPTELVMLFLSQCCCCLEKQMERPLVTPCDASTQPLLLLWHILSSSGRLYPASVLPIVFISHWGTNKHLSRVLESWVVTCWGIFHLILDFCLINTSLLINVFSVSMTLMRYNS